MFSLKSRLESRILQNVIMGTDEDAEIVIALLAPVLKIVTISRDKTEFFQRRYFILKGSRINIQVFIKGDN